MGTCFPAINTGCPTQYIVTRQDLPRGFLAAQVAHAAGRYGKHPPETHVVVLAVANEIELRKTAERLLEAGVGYLPIHEPDEPCSGQMTAIGCALVNDRQPVRKVVSSIPLLR
jgi:hypothetical protein